MRVQCILHQRNALAPLKNSLSVEATKLAVRADGGDYLETNLSGEIISGYAGDRYSC